MRAATLFLVAAACSSTPQGTTALFQLHAGSGDYYALPFPNDLHRKADGTLDLTDFPTNSLIVEKYRMAAETLDGFGLNAAMSSRFSDAIDPTSLPDVAGSTGGSASVYLVDIDAASPHSGARTPIIVDFRTDQTNTIKGNRLVARPYPGFGLDDGTTYALVITDRVKDLAGAPVVADADFAALRGGGGEAAAHAIYQPMFDALGADEAKHVVSAAVFTTQHATMAGPALRAGVYGAPAPVAADVASGGSNATYAIWTGTYEAPNFQTGDPPYTNDGGEIQIGSDGVAIVQRTESMRFAMTVPLGPKPAGGWPICIYQHGTGGDWMTFIQDGTAGRLGAQGIAVISTDQVLHGPRDPAGLDPDIAFFNYANPYAARDNALQGAADAWAQERLAFGLNFSDGNGGTVTVDPTKLMFFGHSQGGLTGPAFVAFEPALKGAVLSGTGGILYLSLLEKTQPIDIPSIAVSLTRDMPLDEDNPTLALAQTWIERADGANYARYFVREPQTLPDGTQLQPRNIFQSEGFTDTYAPNHAIEAFATAVGGDLVMTDATMAVPGLALRERQTLAPPVATNENGVTAVLAQYTMLPGSDGHFVVFEVPAAMTQSASFLGTLAATGTATVVAP
jgi:predicted esterase